jgi:hypothetical protein
LRLDGLRVLEPQERFTQEAHMILRVSTASILMAMLAIGCTGTQPNDSDTSSQKPAAELARQSQAKSETITKLQGELATARTERDELKQALESSRKTGAPGAVELEVSKVDFGFLTSAVNLDDGKVTDNKGDNGIAAYVALYDQFDSSIKAVGSFRLDLFDLKRSKEFVIQTWSFEPDAALKYWQRFPACYQFKLPLSTDVYAKNVVLKVTFRQAGKKDLTATKELTIERP